MPITIYPYNIFESGTVSVTGSTPEDTGFPERRLFDGIPSLSWKHTGSAVVPVFSVDQGASDIKGVDGLFIIGHNFDGETVAWEYDNAGWNDAPGHGGGWAQSDNNMIAKIATSVQTWQEWRVTVTSMDNPEAAEIIMSKGYEFRVKAEGDNTEVDQSNITRIESVGGCSRITKHGVKRKMWNFEIFLADSDDITNMQEVIDELEGIVKPCVIEDVDGNYYLMELLTDPERLRLPQSYGYVNLSFLEKI